MWGRGGGGRGGGGARMERRGGGGGVFVESLGHDSNVGMTQCDGR